MTNRTPAQINALAERAIDLYYDEDITDAATMNLFIDSTGMEYNDDLSTTAALANAIAFDLADLLDNDDDPWYDASDIDSIADAAATKLIARF